MDSDIDDIPVEQILQGVEDIMTKIGWTAQWYTLRGQLIRVIFEPTKGIH